MSPKRQTGAKPAPRTRSARKTKGAPRDPLQPALALLPLPLLAFPVESLGLPGSLRQALAGLALRDVEALLRAAKKLTSVAEIGLPGIDQIRSAIERLTGPGLLANVHACEATSLPIVLGQLLSVLDEDERGLLARRIGHGVEPLPTRLLARRLGLTRPVLVERLASIRSKLLMRAAGVLSRMFDEAQRELQAHEGALCAEHIASGTLLHAPRESGLRQDLALRLLAFCHPRKLHLSGETLSVASRRCLARLAARLRGLGPRAGERLPLAELEARVSARRGPPVSRGVLLLALARAGISVAIDQERGDVVTRAARRPADRVRTILVDLGKPTSLDDLFFHHRDRHKRSSRVRILEALRGDARFLEIGEGLWSLREWHTDELELLREEARRMAQSIVTEGGRHDVRALGEGLSERTTWLLRDCLARDPQLRSLGKGSFCPSTTQRSRVLTTVVRDLEQAMGEVPIARFLSNQPQAQRRLVAHLLRENRLFLAPGTDRIDLLTNYPFHEQRLGRLMELIEGALAKGRGYATLGQLVAEVNATELGGSFVTEELLHDLLRRHASFELLPGGLVALPSLGLTQWVRQRMHEVLRQASMGLSVGEILAEAPVLAEFEACLREVLENDPCVVSRDNLRYVLG